ncbi:MAG TPA: type II CRISPR RNA-guided endonuclease Cas9 [Flavobacteriales bacterium]|nr:type II CRISPR RNA-guided endonuclease Cas9 [Flavobacteriales bacterium]
MKKILGLDLGTTSIGWAVINESESENEQSAIVRTGVRVVPLTTDEQSDFEKGKALSTNADRTLKRGMRRNLDRYQDRRSHLLHLLKEQGLITDDTLLAETGKGTTHSLWALRADAATKPIALEAFARVLLAINKKRGYKSNRKAKDEDEGQAIDGMTIAKELYDNDLTCGQYGLQRLMAGKRHIPDFYRSDLKAELQRIWNKQREYHGELLSHELLGKITGKPQKATWAILKEPWGLVGEKRTTKGLDKKVEDYQWRVDALSKKMTLEELAVVVQQVNGAISTSSGLLGAISDRSKQLMIQDLTVGQFLYKQIQEDRHTPLKGQVFYRQDYLDEFERIWEVQKDAHPQLTPEFKRDVRDTVIFYQRRLKSQKGQLAVCEFEGKKQPVIDENGKPALTKDGKQKMRRVGPRVCPKASPLFQEFRIWQVLNNIELTYQGKDGTGDERSENGILRKGKAWCLGAEYKARLFAELSWTLELSAADALKTIGLEPKEWKVNFKKLEGNRTNQKYLDAYGAMLIASGHDEVDLNELTAAERSQTVEEILGALGVDTGILHFDATLAGKAFEQQPAYALWHLLYSYESDNKSRTGNERLIRHLMSKFGFNRECAEILCKVHFEDDHGSLSARAIKRILPHLKEGQLYNVACDLAGYNHSHSVTAEENEARELIAALGILPKNSLRNPVVEKILNQMVHVVNKVIEVYGRPDEIRVEMARELKKSAKEREEMTKSIEDATKAHGAIRKEIAQYHPFNTGVRITRNDILKYKLYQELKENGFKTLYSQTPVAPEILFGKEFDIEHIIPRSRLFDDSFSNKTLELASVNRDKDKATAMDYMEDKYGPDSEQVVQYKARVERFFKKASPAKFKKLMMKGADIPDGFIDRDLRNTQYITKMALGMLRQVAKTVTPTTGSVTDRLRQDWQLINVLQELNWSKYEKAGLTYTEKNKDGDVVRKIKDWTKRNDHRHHAMDAIAVAFTRPSHIQYLNHLNARRDEDHKKHKVILAIENKETEVDSKGRRYFKPPIPLDELRDHVRKQLESTLVSFKAKNKVTTRNVNKSKTKTGHHRKVELTPRGQLHKESVYGKQQFYATKEVKVGPSMDQPTIAQVAKKSHRQALLLRLHAFDGDPKKAFGGKNALDKNPIWLNEHHKEQVPEKVKLVWMESRYTIRKDITPDLKLDKVVDKKTKRLLEERLKLHGGDAKKAFSNLEEDPIWVNGKKGAQFKRVTITAVSNAEAIYVKRDQHGKAILDGNGQEIPSGYVQTGNNHHVAIYVDSDGNLQDEVVSFFEAVERVRQNNGPINKRFNAELGWTFLFTLKQNEVFVFPNVDTGFDPLQVDLCDEKNAQLIAPNLFRVQKFSKLQYGNSFVRQYVFRHHLETELIDNNELKDVVYKDIKSLGYFNGIQKVRLDHLGRIVHVGEY